MGHQHVPAGEVRAHVFNGCADGVGVAFDARVGEIPLHMDGLHKGQQPEADIAVLVGEGDRLHFAVIDRGEVNARPLHEPPAKGQPLRRVVVAADDEDGEVPLCQAAEKLVKQRYRLGGWDRLIVDVPGDDHQVGA